MWSTGVIWTMMTVGKLPKHHHTMKRVVACRWFIPLCPAKLPRSGWVRHRKRSRCPAVRRDWPHSASAMPMTVDELRQIAPRRRRGDRESRERREPRPEQLRRCVSLNCTFHSDIADRRSPAMPRSCARKACPIQDRRDVARSARRLRHENGRIRRRRYGDARAGTPDPAALVSLCRATVALSARHRASRRRPEGPAGSPSMIARRIYCLLHSVQLGGRLRTKCGHVVARCRP